MIKKYMAWGVGKDGINLGIGSVVTASVTPAKMTILEQEPFISRGVKKIEPSFVDPTQASAFVLVLCYDGTVWAWGKNDSGQLGNGTTTDSLSTPVQVNIPVAVVDIDCGYAHGIAVDINGDVWTWGRNAEGELGNGSNTNASTPVKIGITNAVACFAGVNCSFVTDNTGRVWAFGYSGTAGQLGTGSTANVNSTPTKVQTGSGDLTGITKVHNIWADGYTYVMETVFLSSDGSLWGTGLNASSEFGVSGSFTVATKLTNWPAEVADVALGLVAYGVYTSGKSFRSYSGNMIVITSDGKVYGCGSNQSGSLGTGSTANYTTPILIAIDKVLKIAKTKLTGRPVSSTSLMFATRGFHSLISTKGTLLLSGKSYNYMNGQSALYNSSLFQELNIVSGIKEIICATRYYNEAVDTDASHSLIFAYNPDLALHVTDPNGNILTNIDQGVQTAGTSRDYGPYEVHNYTGNTLAQVQVTVDTPPIGDQVTLSPTATPFTPQSPLVFNGSFPDKSKVGNVYTRVQTPLKYIDPTTGKEVDNSGRKTYNLHVTGT